jgi:hypothetical protein
VDHGLRWTGQHRRDEQFGDGCRERPLWLHDSGERERLRCTVWPFDKRADAGPGDSGTQRLTASFISSDASADDHDVIDSGGVADSQDVIHAECLADS